MTRPTHETYAFRLGCDARNDYEPISTNPYTKESQDWQDWRKGWIHTDNIISYANKDNC